MVISIPLDIVFEWKKDNNYLVNDLNIFYTISVDEADMKQSKQILDFETSKDIYGRAFTFLRAGRVKGRNQLLSQGFTQCDNPDYLQRGNSYMHYNKNLGVWFYEDK